ncbi:MAG TPA: hypothetical protein VGS21_00330 [Acidimicrobiales bacterium]|nr:hypothetical protein [Acidimicrobiales bacterium]
MIVIAGHLGSDGGYTWIDGEGGIHVVPGWSPEAVEELRSLVAIAQEATMLKTPGVAESIVKTVYGHIQKELPDHVQDGGVLILT